MSSEFSPSQRKIAIYIRVSTQEQKIDGYGLEAQKKRLLQYVTENTSRGYVTKPEWIFSDVHTGSDINRPQLQHLLKQVDKGVFSAVLVWKIDRLSRSLKHLLGIFDQFEKKGVSFVSLQENIDFTGPIGKLIFQIFGAIAQFERELIKGRTRMGKITSAEMGNFTGSHIPYGYKPVPNPHGKGKKLAVIPQEKKWVQNIYQWHIYEHMGFLKIAKRMNSLKVPKGKFGHHRSQSTPWTERLVEDILTSPLYRGEYIANKTDENGHLLAPEEWTVVSIPPCVTEFTFQQAKEARRLHHNGSQSMDYLLSGKLIDMSLDKPKKFSGAKRHKGGFSYRRQQFKDQNGTHHPVFEITGTQMEQYVWDKIMHAMNHPKEFITSYLSKEYADPKLAEQLQHQLDALREKKANVESVEIARIESAYERGIYDEDKLQEKLTAKEQEVVEIETSIGTIEDQLALMGSASQEIQKLKEASEQIKYQLDKLTRPQKKILCQLFVDRIEMYRTRPKGQHRWDVQAKIFFRFNPESFPTKMVEGRTYKAQHKDDFGDSEGKIDVSGGERGGTYSFFVFRVKYESDLSKVVLKEI